MTQPPPPQQPYAQQPYPPQPPPKKGHVLRNILLVVAGVLVLGCGGCLAIVATGLNEVDKAISESEENDKKPGGPDNPLEIQAGEPFEINGMEFQSGWRLKNAAGLGTSIEGLKVKNNREGEGKVTEFVEIKFMKGNEVLGLSDCSANAIAYKQIATLSCIATDKVMKGYDSITVNDTF